MSHGDAGWGRPGGAWPGHAPTPMPSSGQVTVSRPPLGGFVRRALAIAVPAGLLLFVTLQQPLRSRPGMEPSGPTEAAVEALVGALIPVGIYAFWARWTRREIAVDPLRREVVVAGERAPMSEVTVVAIASYKQTSKQYLRIRAESRAKAARHGGTIRVALRSGKEAHRPLRSPVLARRMPERDARVLAQLGLDTSAAGGPETAAELARIYGWDTAGGSHGPGARQGAR